MQADMYAKYREAADRGLVSAAALKDAMAEV